MFDKGVYRIVMISCYTYVAEVLCTNLDNQIQGEWPPEGGGVDRCPGRASVLPCMCHATAVNSKTGRVGTGSRQVPIVAVHAQGLSGVAGANCGCECGRPHSASGEGGIL